jgi:hypothetical protein
MLDARTHSLRVSKIISMNLFLMRILMTITMRLTSIYYFVNTTRILLICTIFFIQTYQQSTCPTSSQQPNQSILSSTKRMQCHTYDNGLLGSLHQSVVFVQADIPTETQLVPV